MEEEINTCPICNKAVGLKDIEVHVNNCLFFHSSNNENNAAPSKKRKLITPSPKTKKTLNSSLNNPPKFDIQTENQQEPFNLKQAPVKYFTETPLADAVRPKHLDDFIGQEQVIGPQTILCKLLMGANLPSLIFWGPPGCGKTTLANVVKETLLQKHKDKNGPPIRFVKLHATTAGVNDVKEVINAAKNELKLFQRRTILFMDEIHRFNKSQQDTFLPHIESGTITLIGATTENPSFSLNNALLSRCRVITLDKLLSENIVKILVRAVDYAGGCFVPFPDEGHSRTEINNAMWIVDGETIQWLADISDGDARIALNSLQMAIESRKADVKQITLDDIKDSIKRSHIFYDKKGDEHYNIISALHKSIRASHDNASLYWLTRMLQGGEDPIYIARRLVRLASEDIGLAEPNALILAVSTLHGCQQIGMPECDVLLAQLAVYLARCPKSREVYHALNAAKATIVNHKGALPSVPLDLRNAPTKFMKDLGYGKNYNTEDKSVSGFEYMPEGFERLSFFDIE